MDIIKPKMGTQTVPEDEFNVPQFEKQLTTLKDSQEAINQCCQWCLQNRTHHKKIVTAWLNVLKRVRVEQRLVLFYLANDVVQYSKRKNYDFVESWGIALQKATTMVRDEKVKHKILRIFKIWEQRSVYNEEFISDLCGLLSVLPNSQKSDEPNEFQPTYVINKIKSCSKLEKDTDVKLKILKEHNPKIQVDDALIVALKDRAHDDVEKEIDDYIKHMENYINALKLEVKNRTKLITVLKQAESQLEMDRKDVKVVANAYKMFGTRVKTFQRKLVEHKETLSSPIPSPDVNAPSPSPDSDIDLPDEAVTEITPQKEATPTHYNPKAELQFNAGYYTPTTTTSITEHGISNSFLSNGVSSFIGSESFNLENFNSSLFSNISSFSNTSSIEPSVTSAQPPLPASAAVSVDYNYSNVTGVQSLQPPPMPPFTKAEGDYQYGQGYTQAAPTVSYGYDTSTTNYMPTDVVKQDTYHPEAYQTPMGSSSYPPNEEYNAEDNTQAWEPEASWKEATRSEPTKTDTPESPPMFEKEGYTDPVEYHDHIPSGAVDVDQRVLPSISADMDPMSRLGGKDVDHRNLISLTGSPGRTCAEPAPESTWNRTDQDYRIPPPSTTASSNPDQDYRLGFNLEHLKLPPPPPPPPKDHQGAAAATRPAEPAADPRTVSKSPRRSDNIENIDMDLSDDEGRGNKSNENLKVILSGPAAPFPNFSGLEPPPPLPNLPDDEDANNFLDNLVDDLHEFSGLVGDDVSIETAPGGRTAWEKGPMCPPPPMMPFNDMVGPPLMPPQMNASVPPPRMDTSVPPPQMGTAMPPPPPTPPAMQMMNHPSMMSRPPQPWLLEDEQRQQHQNGGGHVGPTSEQINFDDDNRWAGGVSDMGGIDMGGMDMPNEGGEGSWDNSYPHHHPPNDWVGPPPPNMGFGFRGRGNHRGSFNNNAFVKRGRGRGNGGNKFMRGGNVGGGAGPRSNRGFFPRGNFRGNFRGGF